jgi:CheY-like chemotaxis protein
MYEPTGPLSILMVDDDRAAAEMYSAALRRNGHVVRVAGDGWSGLQEALQDPPDLLLLDLHLPVMDGHAVLELLRQHTDTWRLPTVMLSNQNSLEVLRRSEELGALAHLVKCQTTPARLCGLVRDWCRSGFAASLS